MMTLHWSPRSPFVRKVMIVLNETGQSGDVDCIRSTVAMMAQPNPDVLSSNPLGKIPTLILEDGTSLFDSRVICAYLAARAGMLVSDNAGERLCQARWEALGDGMTDILLLWRIELARAGKAEPLLCAAFETKIRAVLAFLDAEAGALAATPLGLGHIAIFCALGQLEFRWPGTGWRDAHPNLATWFAGLSMRPAFAATAVVDDTPASSSPTAPPEAVFTFEKS
ncbi:glutathione S-transferase [Rhizobium sp. FY34]|uniref:glutathione S-transferase family protein n=1 Tax=Rhizobium sp. FY34 TaxID=2562309 RepID=UPI001980A508|nr:glutathione S-transferase [Rhizobium sp. FY34]